ncbi:helix-turn-helix transcriptional regulator [Amycolatopsis sp. FDAARGOS 1241]|uniref:helix-turn-helix transcriptional regulator n=1 Tax=Amycolatopsis sp. FDAARGOS 1241 TaxID=2778070 RepID=UPI00194DD47F|nr:helix-turn-helix transcriptional regulator [Amycolatopsis sp. FDAARGOS 1241]QRP43586.1 transcriptional regulator [Amycolatopsis sp. FDAARGOS 1241]
MSSRPPVLEQLHAATERLAEIRLAQGWGLREMGRVLGVGAPTIHAYTSRALTTSTLPLLDAYARQLGCRVRVLLVEDDPGEQRHPWRDRMPHGEVCADTHGMTEAWRLQRNLHRLRREAGHSRDEFAAALGLRPITLWRLETNPAAADAAFTNVMVLARFFGYTLQLRLEREQPLAP